MALDFPTNPALNEIYTYGGRSWQWNGTAWDVYSTTTVVNTLNGLTGTVGLSAGSNITVTSAGNTITISSSASSGGISGPYVISFNGITGAVTGVTTGTANTFGPLQSFTTGISASGGVTLAGTLQGTTANFTGLVSSTVGFSGSGTNLNNIVKTINGLSGAVGLTNGNGIGISVSGNTLTFSNTGVLSFNGLTGAVTGVASIRGLTGAVGLTNGTGIGLSVSGQTMTFSNTGVLSVNESTGTVTNVALTNVDNNFTEGQTTVSTITGNSTTLQPTSIFHYYDFSTNTQLWQSADANSTITFPNYTTTLAGLAGTQIFTGTNTFSTLTNFTSGISASGGTFSALTRFNSGISSAGGTFSALTRFTAGISAAGGTFSDLVTFNAGISAAGATFSGTLSINGQTFSNLVQSFNGFTGSVGGWINTPGFTTAAQTWNDSTSNGSKTIYYLPTHYLSQADWGSYTVAANRAYFSLYNTNKSLTIKTIRALSNSTVTTGNAYISVYSSDINTGLPSTRLYNSASIAVGSGYSGVSVTNAGGLVTVPAGFFYISITFSSTPIMFGFNRYRIPGIFGASSYSAGPYNIMPMADYSGFTTAAQLPISGVSLGYLENSASSYIGPVVEFAI